MHFYALVSIHSDDTFILHHEHIDDPYIYVTIGNKPCTVVYNSEGTEVYDSTTATMLDKSNLYSDKILGPLVRGFTDMFWFRPKVFRDFMVSAGMSFKDGSRLSLSDAGYKSLDIKPRTAVVSVDKRDISGKIRFLIINRHYEIVMDMPQIHDNTGCDVYFRVSSVKSNNDIIRLNSQCGNIYINPRGYKIHCNKPEFSDILKIMEFIMPQINEAIKDASI